MIHSFGLELWRMTFEEKVNYKWFGFIEINTLFVREEYFIFEILSANKKKLFSIKTSNKLLLIIR